MSAGWRDGEGGLEAVELSACYPLIFEPILLEKVWGGRRLGRYGKRLPDGRDIGESWELADLDATAASGAGGGAQRSVIANGSLRGRTLREAMALWGADLLGAARPTQSGGFPLLVKLLDARENLSVQVHPSPAYAAAHPGCHVKTECWYVLEAEPGSVIYKGTRPGVTPAAFRAHIADGTVADDLIAVPAIPGDCHLLPSGTCHALGAGVLVAEVQTPSDTTFRVYDWGRAGRGLHVEEALGCIEFGPALAVARRTAGPGAARLAHTSAYTMEHVEGATEWCARAHTCVVVMAVRGSAEIEVGDECQRVSAGEVALVPAAIAADAVVRVDDSSAALCVRLGAGE